MVQAQQKLATACGAASAVELAANHACGLMLYMLQRSSQWTATHADISSFVAILETCPGETLAAIGEPLCLSLSQITRDSDRDPALRMEILRAMHKVFEDDARAPAFCAKFGMQLTVLVLLPPLIWRAGVLSSIPFFPGNYLITDRHRVSLGVVLYIVNYALVALFCWGTRGRNLDQNRSAWDSKRVRRACQVPEYLPPERLIG